MVYKWECQHCSYTVWSANKASLDDEVKSHLFDHNLSNVRKRDFRYTWNCPYCASSTTTHDKETVVDQFQSHLYDHVADRICSGSHVAERVDHCGNVLVEVPVASDSANHARKHFFTYGDTIIIVTSDPEDRIRFVDETLAEWPTHTVVLTTKRQPLSSELDIDFSDISIEIVELDQRLGPDQLGETISRVIDHHHRPDRQLSFGFDIMYEIIQSFDLQTSYEFVNRISRRLEDAGAISHFYMDPHPQLESIINVLDDRFDLELVAEGEVLRVKN